MFWYGLKGSPCAARTQDKWALLLRLLTNGGKPSSEIKLMIYLRQLSLISPYHYCAVHTITLCCCNIVFGSSLRVRTCYYFTRHVNETLRFLTDLLCLLILLFTLSGWRSSELTRVEHLLREETRADGFITAVVYAEHNTEFIINTVVVVIASESRRWPVTDDVTVLIRMRRKRRLF
jgi:hypothetical protein